MNIYSCDICNKDFKSKGSLTSHRNWHKPEYAEKGKLGGKNASSVNKQNHILRKELKESVEREKYVHSPKTCKECSIILPYEYRNRSFCSKQCSGKHSNRDRNPESRQKQIDSLKKTNLKNRIYDYPRLPALKTCVICGDDHRRGGKTCSKECFKKHVSNQVTGKTGGFRNFGGGNRGFTHGILYQSGWEKIWIEYHVQENIPFRRCTEYFEYEYEGKVRKYYPDFFLIEENSYVEVKGFWSELTEAKLASIPSEYGVIVCQGKEIEELRRKLR